MGAHCAAKAGAAPLTRRVEREVGREGVTVETISLGTTRTPVSEAMWSTQTGTRPGSEEVVRRRREDTRRPCPGPSGTTASVASR